LSGERAHLAVFGAHVGDSELAAGAIVAKYSRAGHRATIVHMTMGERGHPSLSGSEYAEQKRREALESARVLGADVRFMGYRDGELPVSEEAKLQVCDLVRELKPNVVLTHWEGSYHKDHKAASLNVQDGLFYAGLRPFERRLPAHGASLYFFENWEDPLGFELDIYVDVSEVFETYLEAMGRHEFAKGVFSGFPYIEYYRALARVRGAEAGCTQAVAFMIPRAWGAWRRRAEFLH